MRAHGIFFALGIVAALAACSVPEKRPGDGDGGVDAGDTDASDRDVTGTSMLTHYLRTGDSITRSMSPEDLTIYSFAAYVPDTNEPTGFRIIPGVGNAQGQLNIPDVPIGPYYFRSQLSGAAAPTFFYTDDRVLQLGFGTAGRPGQPDVMLPSTINPNITGLDRAYDSDMFSMHSLGSGTEHYPINFNGNHPVGNVASLTAAYEWTAGYGWALPRMRPKLLQNDDLEILHHRKTQTGNGEVTSTTRLIEIARMAGLTQVDGVPLTVNGAFTDVTQNLSVMVNVQLAPLRAAYGANPNVRENVDASLGALAALDPYNGFGPGLVALNVFNIRPATTSFTMTLPYGDPYDQTWAHIAFENYTRVRRIRVPGVVANGPANNITTNMNLNRPYTSGAIGPTVQVGPPTNIRVGGVTASDGVRTFDGIVPITVQWTAVTNATRYQVSARRLIAPTVNQQPPVVATVITTETSATIPAALFATGERYVFIITSIRDGLPFASGRLRDGVSPAFYSASSTGVILLSNSCGNGAREGAEECDTSGQSATCDIDCSLPLCLDGVVNTAANEQCDGGFATGGCDANCTLATCGDGTVNVFTGEECDDSNMNNGDGCSDQCRWEDSCPDGIEQPLYGEECDDNNMVNTDDCVNCRAAYCTDGFVQTGVEQCDDGNYVNGDGCSDSCTTEP